METVRWLLSKYNYLSDLLGFNHLYCAVFFYLFIFTIHIVFTPFCIIRCQTLLTVTFASYGKYIMSCNSDKCIKCISLYRKGSISVGSSTQESAGSLSVFAKPCCI